MYALNVQLLMTGNELMSGDIVDSNSSMIAKQLSDLGIAIERKVTVNDDLEQLVAEIVALTAQSDIVIINGGLGPTVDDLTAQALALAANLPLEIHSRALSHLENWCQRRGFTLNEPNKKQALLPKDCEIIANDVGSAVGFSLTVNNCLVLCTPGVPSELKRMMHQEILPKIAALLPTELQQQTDKLFVFGLGESTIQLMINEAFPDWPKEVDLGFRAAMPQVEVKLTTKNKDAHQIRVLWLAKVKALLGDHILSDKAISLEQLTVSLLKDKQQSICLAESCTGGLIAHKITQVPGASAVFHAGFVTYSNQMKTQLLNVPEQLLNVHGAVSKAVVTSMAQNALTISQSDYVIAVSGIAGPDGGSEEKPVGTVWLAWGTKTQLMTKCLYIPGTRQYFQQYVACAGLDLIRRLLINSQEQPKYFVDRALKR